jgi:hypothetical protein
MGTALVTQETRRLTLEPNTLAEAKEFSDIVANSDLAPKDYRGKPANVLVAIQFGKELGVAPMQALQGIAVINGRPSVWGDLMWALVTTHPAFEDAIEEVTETEAKVTLKRRGRSPVTVTFTKADAEKAGLWIKAGPWMQYPKRQMLWRARTFAARDLFPDALKGMVSAEEAGDYNDGPTIEGTVTQTITQAVVPPVTQDQAREFGKAWKASGHTIEDAKAKLRELFDVDSSLKIPSDGFDKAMTWAKTPKQTAQGPDEKLCREMFGILEYDLTKQAQAIADANGDWAALAQKLNKELPEDK